MRVLSVSSGLALAWTLGLELAPGCTRHADPPEPALPSAPQAVIAEVEPKPAEPALVAPKLPDLAPTRPLANLGLIWRQDPEDDPRHDAMWTLGTSVVGIDEDTAAILGLSDPPDDLSLVMEEAYEVRRVGPLLVSSWDLHYVAHEAGAGGLRWQTDEREGARSYLYFTDERVLVATFSYARRDELSAWALDDGRLLWTRASEDGTDFERFRELGTDGERGYVAGDRGLEAFDPATGATRWRTSMVAPTCGFALGERLVLVEDPAGARILDAELGTELGRIGPQPGRCLWFDYVAAAATISGGRFYVFDGTGVDQYTMPEVLRVYDLETKAELWSVEGYSSESLVVDHDAVYVMGGGERFVALDAATGSPVYDHGIGMWFTARVEPIGGPLGPVVLVEDDDTSTWVFGRKPEPTPPESWEIRGQLVSDGYLDKKRLRGVTVIVGEEMVETDGKGRFVAKGRGLGMVWVSYPYGEEYYDPETMSLVEFEPEQVQLDGSGRYDVGSLEAYEGYIE